MGSRHRTVLELRALSGLHALRVLVEQRITEVVRVCREQGVSWADIAATLYVSKQAAHGRCGHREPRSTTTVTH